MVRSPSRRRLTRHVVRAAPEDGDRDAAGVSGRRNRASPAATAAPAAASHSAPDGVTSDSSSPPAACPAIWAPALVIVNSDRPRT
ncbi:hypothetical protein LUX33_36020 [Actinomadura madurae]|nr:hypothetical protein [Actinomadura madurae]MCP9953312.1 hypothetical protein [Actinomadura madurae]MCP9970071.1 hypothetical protein [Actinomadura madurae]MCP9982530.1 hypothetical protein [Actinomadura madurae]